MYEFRGIDIDRSVQQDERPIEALNYGGHWLDDEISGYTTLVTTGRHEFTRQVTSQDRVDDGALYLSSRLESRKVEVQFKLEAQTIAEYNERLEKLERLLFEPNQPFYFADDPKFHFVGSVTELSLDKGTLNTAGKITLSATDPYRYGDQKTIEGSGSSLTINDPQLSYDQTPQRIEFTPSATAANLAITCGDKAIKLSEGVPAGQKVVVDFESLNLSINAVNNLMALTLDSNLSDFYIRDGSTINFNASGSYKLVYEVKQL
jgi:predicted phage tail component-like protein